MTAEPTGFPRPLYWLCPYIVPRVLSFRELANPAYATEAGDDNSLSKLHIWFYNHYVNHTTSPDPATATGLQERDGGNRAFCL